MNDCVIGLDLGTTGCKAALYTVDGRLLARSYRLNTMLTPAPGLAEQSPEQWWQNACACIRQVVADARVPKQTVIALAVSSAGGILAVDRSGKPLTNIIMQIDQRAAGFRSGIERSLGGSAFTIAGNTLSGGVSNLPNILWLKSRRPDLYEKTHALLMPNGFIVHRLTGQFVGDVSRCATLLLMDIEKKQWSPRLCQALDIDMDKLPRLLRCSEPAGTLTSAAAAQTGLSERTIVSAGLMDTAAASIGADVMHPQDACIILGTFGKLCMAAQRSLLDPGFLNCPYVDDETYLAIAVTDGGCGMALNWFLDGFAAGDDKRNYKKWDGLAADIVPTGNEPLYLPFLCGGRSPEWASDVYGGFFNTRREHSAVHFYYSILEGIALSARYALQEFVQKGRGPAGVLHAGGGGSRSDIWLQIFANVTGLPVARMDDPDTEAAGAAWTAAAAAGGTPAWDLPCSRTFLPDPALADLYADRYDRYVRLRSAAIAACR